MKSSVNGDRQFELDALGCSQASVICSERRRPAIDRAAALSTDWRRLRRQAGTVCRRGTLQMLNYMLLTVVVNGHNCVTVRQRNVTCRTNASIDVRRRSVCVNAAVEINVLVAVRQRAATFGAVRSVNGV